MPYYLKGNESHVQSFTEIFSFSSTTINDFINLELGVKRFNGNMTKFHYNPVALTPITREWFDHLQTLFIYAPEDNRFENDKRIIARENAYLRKYVSKNEEEQLEEWTGLKCEETVFDSDVDD